MKTVDVVVVGAGISGLLSAQQLASRGADVLVIEKARGSGGRLSSKRMKAAMGAGGELDLTFDLGAPSFRLSDGYAKQAITESSGGEVLVLLEGRVERFVAQPRNSALTRALTNGLNVMFSTRVEQASFDGSWELLCSGSEGECKVKTKELILSSPPHQAAALLGEQHPAYQSLLDTLMLPQWVVALALKPMSDIAQLESAVEESSMFSGMSVEQDKPGRSVPDSIQLVTLQCAPRWTEEHLDSAPEQILQRVLDELVQQTGMTLTVLTHHVHRWLYSLPPATKSTLNQQYWPEHALGLCGDYLAPTQSQTGTCYEGVERAVLSALSLLEERSEKLK